MSKALVLLCAAIITLMGCAKIHGTNTSVWSEIFWIPWVLGIVSAFAWYKAITIKKKVGRWDKWYVFLGIVLPIAIIVMIIGVYGSR